MSIEIQDAPLLIESALDDSSLFTSWTDPGSGVTSYILSRRVAPLQQSFYFVNPSVTPDGRYYWFYAAFPPSGSANYGRCLGVVDFKERTVRCFPETQFLDASPGVHPVTGEIYWCSGADIWKRGPRPHDGVVWVNRLPAALTKGRRPWRLTTHITFSADGKAINFDAQIGSSWHVGHIPLDGGEPVVWRTFDRCYNHTQFNPADPGLQLIAQDYWTDPKTGEPGGIEHRMWLLRRDGEPQALYPGGGSRMQGHEWWSADGQRVWYIHYHHGVEYIDIHEGKPVRVWPLKTVSHADVDAAERFVVADFLPGEAPEERRVVFYDRAKRQEIEIVSHLPHPPKGQDETKYHIHPHPQFCAGDRLICYTTTVLGQADVAFVPVAELLDR